jgi:CRISPR type III-A-associated RAMP protein Csm4
MPLDRPALLVQLQPLTPWRCGSGRPGEPASLVPSDSLFAALCHAFGRLGWRDEWLSEGAAAVRLSSLFPSLPDFFFAPLASEVRDLHRHSKRVRMSAVRFATFGAIRDLAEGKFDDGRWVLDLSSGCLLPADRAGAGGPFRPIERTRAAVDRATRVAVESAVTSGIDFGGNGGAWCMAVFNSDAARHVWAPRLKGAFRFLADDGIGGWRAAGWGRSRRPKYREGTLGQIAAKMGWPVTAASDRWWSLGLIVPADSDAIDWTAGAYGTIERFGASAGGEFGPYQKYVREGSVLQGAVEPLGSVIAIPNRRVAPRYGAGLVMPWPASESPQ